MQITPHLFGRWSSLGGDGGCMTDFSHWNFAPYFSGEEAAALIVGLEPSESVNDRRKAEPVYRRLEQSFRYFLMWAEVVGSDGEDHEFPDGCTSLINCAWENKDRDSISIEWLESNNCDFERQVFSRQEIVRWLRDIGLESVYSFELTNVDTVHLDPGTDPADYPDELYAANLAFRAVTNGYGGKSDTFKNRLVSYLESTHAHLSKEAVQRIATVANADKTTGRKKSSRA
jgi:hypothetical protein